MRDDSRPRKIATCLRLPPETYIHLQGLKIARHQSMSGVVTDLIETEWAVAGDTVPDELQERQLRRIALNGILRWAGLPVRRKKPKIAPPMTREDILWGGKPPSSPMALLFGEAAPPGRGRLLRRWRRRRGGAD